MLQRHQLEIYSLHRRPQHPILLQRCPICAFQLLSRITPFHDSHTTQKTTQIQGCEDGLIGENASGDGKVGAGGEVYAACEKGKPRGGCGAEDG